jgi:hypothetical protein
MKAVMNGEKEFRRWVVGNPMWRIAWGCVLVLWSLGIFFLIYYIISGCGS